MKSKRTCQKCFRQEPHVTFISSSGNYCEACMAILRWDERERVGLRLEFDHSYRNTPTAGPRDPERSKVQRERNRWKMDIYHKRYHERLEGVPEDQLTPLPSKEIA